MNHHDDVGIGFQRMPITGLLVSAVAQVVFMRDDGQSEFPGDFHGLVGAAIIDEDQLFANGNGTNALDQRRQRFRRFRGCELPPWLRDNAVTKQDDVSLVRRDDDCLALEFLL